MSTMRGAGNQPVSGSPVVNWKIASQTPMMGVGDDGRYVQGYQITWTADNGTSGTFFIPAIRYGVDAVSRAVAAQVQRVGQVHSLTGEVRLG